MKASRDRNRVVGVKQTSLSVGTFLNEKKSSRLIDSRHFSSLHRTWTRAERLFQNLNRSYFFSVHWSAFCVDFPWFLEPIETGESLWKSYLHPFPRTSESIVLFFFPSLFKEGNVYLSQFDSYNIAANWLLVIVAARVVSPSFSLFLAVWMSKKRMGSKWKEKQEQVKRRERRKRNKREKERKRVRKKSSKNSSPSATFC